MGHNMWPSTRLLLILAMRSRTEEKKGGEKGERERESRTRESRAVTKGAWPAASFGLRGGEGKKEGKAERKGE